MCAKFDALLNNIIYEFPICSVVTGDFNAHNSRWWKNYIANSAALELDSLTLSAAYTEIMHIQMSCINLMFCTKLNVNSKHSADGSIFDNCHHDNNYGKTNICVPLTPIYVRKVWDYTKANVEKELSNP